MPSAVSKRKAESAAQAAAAAAATAAKEAAASSKSHPLAYDRVPPRLLTSRLEYSQTSVHGLDRRDR